MATNTPSKVGLRKRAAHELWELIALTAYLYVAFAALIFYKRAILHGQGVEWMPWGLAIVKALLVAKFILIGRAFHIGERYRTKPLIWPTLYKSTIFLAVVFILTAVEESIVGLFHGRTMEESISAIGGGTPGQLLAMLLLVFLIFLPYFAIGSLGEIMGERAILGLFFIERKDFRPINRSQD